MGGPDRRSPAAAYLGTNREIARPLGEERPLLGESDGEASRVDTFAASSPDFQIGEGTPLRISPRKTPGFSQGDGFIQNLTPAIIRQSQELARISVACR